MIVAMVVVLASLGKFPLFLKACLSSLLTLLPRFESRDVCDDIIKTFNNTVVKKPNGDDHIIQIRFSDTHEQKLLKQQTAAARQFRAQEFEFGCQEAIRNGSLPPQSVQRLQAVISTGGAPVGNEFENFLQNNTNTQGVRYIYPRLSVSIQFADFCHSYGTHMFNGARVPLPTIRSGDSFVIDNNGGSPVSNGGVKIEDGTEPKTRASTPGSASRAPVKASPSKLSSE
jgi:hypothetical protein